MTLRLIVNADDYCRAPSVSRGIREAHQSGIVSSTTCMMNYPNAAADLALAQVETPALGLGVHLVLTSGTPLTPPEHIATLVDADYQFLTLDAFLTGLEQIDTQQVRLEWRAQIDRFVAVTGQAPTHLDAHHHTAYYSAPLFQMMLELAREYGCAVRQVVDQAGDVRRGLPAAVALSLPGYAPSLLAQSSVPTTDLFYASFYGEEATVENLLATLAGLPVDGLFELMCHPGYSDAALEAGTSYGRQRENELTVLTDDAVVNAVRAHGIELVTF